MTPTAIATKIYLEVINVGTESPSWPDRCIKAIAEAIKEARKNRRGFIPIWLVIVAGLLILGLIGSVQNPAP